MACATDRACGLSVASVGPESLRPEQIMTPIDVRLGNETTASMR